MDDNALAAFGLNKEDIPDEEIEVLPDVWPSFLVFEGMYTQWRVGMGGAIGLDYNALPFVIEATGNDKDETKYIFPDIQVMEHTAMKVMADQNKLKQE